MLIFVLIALASSAYSLVYAVHCARRRNPAGAAGAGLLLAATLAVAAFFFTALLRQM